MLSKIIYILTNSRVPIPTRRKTNAEDLILLFMIIFGIITGFLTKYFNIISYRIIELVSYTLGRHLHQFFSGIGNIATSYPVWLFTSTLISIYSRDPILAGLRVFLYLQSANASYAFFTMYYLGVWSPNQFLFLRAVGILSFGYAWLAWYGAGKTKFSKIIGALPIVYIICDAVRMLHYLEIKSLWLASAPAVIIATDLIFATALAVLIIKKRRNVGAFNF